MGVHLTSLVHWKCLHSPEQIRARGGRPLAKNEILCFRAPAASCETIVVGRWLSSFSGEEVLFAFCFRFDLYSQPHVRACTLSLVPAPNWDIERPHVPMCRS